MTDHVDLPSLECMHDIEEVPGHRFATLIKNARIARSWTQEDLVDATGISRQTIIRYESGRAVLPRPTELRNVCTVLNIDIREALVAIGYITRDEMSLPTNRLPASLNQVHRILVDPNIPDGTKRDLEDLIDAGVRFWFARQGIQPPPRERSARDRTAPKGQVRPQRQ